MATPAPVRSGFRVAGPEAPATAYAHPPLVECWLETNLAAGNLLTPADFAALIAKLGPEWPQRSARPSQGGDLRLTNAMGDRVLRLSADGFGFGWLGHGGERYPRYEAVRDGFVAVLDLVRDIVKQRTGTFTPITWAVRYVNRIPCGTVWSTAGDWSFFRLWQPHVLTGLGVEPSGFQGRWDLPLEAERGHLTIQFRHDGGATSDASSPESSNSETSNSVWIELTASSTAEDTETSLFDGLDYGREVIVRSFNELVSAEAKEYWGVALPVRQVGTKAN